MIEEYTETEYIQGIPRFSVHSSIVKLQRETDDTGELLEVLGDYERYSMGWASNHEIDCVKVVKRKEGFFIIPFGKVPDGYKYEDNPIGPFVSSNLALQEAIFRLQK